ncbi:hypothetical protein KDL44_08410 [bacterium]|nr:hypothetical protein [bacterium]
MLEILRQDSWLIIPVLALMIPIIAIITAQIGGHFERLERMRARQMYENLVREKLDVMRTAVAMGRDEDEIALLDERLERLIGTREMGKLLGKKKPGVPEISHELEASEFDAERERLRSRPRKRRQDA